MTVAKLAVNARASAAARFNSVHALELAVKATLAASLGEMPRTHNVGGEFGKHFREIVGAEVARRVNRILHDYDGPRYPDWEPPDPATIHDDILFIEAFIEKTVPRLRAKRGSK